MPSPLAGAQVGMLLNRPVAMVVSFTSVLARSSDCGVAPGFASTTWICAVGSFSELAADLTNASHLLVGSNIGQELSSALPVEATIVSRPENVSPETESQPIDAAVALRPLAFGPIANTRCAPSGDQSGMV